MLQEKWIRWEPVEGLISKYFIDDVVDATKEFSVKLSDINNENEAKIFFEHGVISYIRTDETLRSRLVLELKKNMEENFMEIGPFLK